MSNRYFPVLMLFMFQLFQHPVVFAIDVQARMHGVGQIQHNTLDASAGSQYAIDQRLMLSENHTGLSWELHGRIEWNYLSDTTDTNIAWLDSSYRHQVQALDMHHLVRSTDQQHIVTEIDRLYASFSFMDISWSVGRTALSWGNGMAFSVLDIFNPFDPLRIDQEYKPGTDMIFAQYNVDSWNDIQVLVVPRRDPVDFQIDAEFSSLAVKFHRIEGRQDLDLLLASHYDETIFGIGYANDLSGYLWRNDLLFVDTQAGREVSALSNLSYAWVVRGKNLHAFIEFFFNSYGEEFETAYTLQSIMQNQALFTRLQRGEVFTLGRRYLALGANLEWHPLFYVYPAYYRNLDDHSGVSQIYFHYDVSESAVMRAGFTRYHGSNGTEYGGVNTDISVMAPADQIFVQLTLYF